MQKIKRTIVVFTGIAALSTTGGTIAVATAATSNPTAAMSTQQNQNPRLPPSGATGSTGGRPLPPPSPSGSKGDHCPNM